MSPKKIQLPRLHQLVERLKPAATRIKPFAKKSRKVAKEKVHRSRQWAAPRVERSGHVLEETVAPKVSHLLSSAAHLIEPKANGGSPADAEQDAAPTPIGDGQARSESPAKT